MELSIPSGVKTSLVSVEFCEALWPAFCLGIYFPAREANNPFCRTAAGHIHYNQKCAFGGASVAFSKRTLNETVSTFLLMHNLFHQRRTTVPCQTSVVEPSLHPNEKKKVGTIPGDNSNLLLFCFRVRMGIRRDTSMKSGAVPHRCSRSLPECLQ